LGEPNPAWGEGKSAIPYAQASNTVNAANIVRPVARMSRQVNDAVIKVAKSRRIAFFRLYEKEQRPCRLGDECNDSSRRVRASEIARDADQLALSLALCCSEPSLKWQRTQRKRPGITAGALSLRCPTKV
jgi:hypothetical protein